MSESGQKRPVLIAAQNVCCAPESGLYRRQRGTFPYVLRMVVLPMTVRTATIGAKLTYYLVANKFESLFGVCKLLILNIFFMLALTGC